MRPQNDLEDYAKFEQARAHLKHVEGAAPWHSAAVSPWSLASMSEHLKRQAAEWSSMPVVVSIGHLRAVEARHPTRRATREPGEPAVVTELRARVRKLEAQVTELMNARPTAIAVQGIDHQSSGDTVPLGPHERWIEAHVDELRKYPNCWVLLDPERGIVFHAEDRSAFAAYLERFGPEERARLMPFHTSMYV